MDSSPESLNKKEFKAVFPNKEIFRPTTKGVWGCVIVDCAVQE